MQEWAIACALLLSAEPGASRQNPQPEPEPQTRVLSAIPHWELVADPQLPNAIDELKQRAVTESEDVPAPPASQGEAAGKLEIQRYKVIGEPLEAQGERAAVIGEPMPETLRILIGEPVAEGEPLPDAEREEDSSARTGRRETMRMDDRSFLDVVAVGHESGFHCSGVLVGPTLVLTARHCLPANRVLFGVDVNAPLAEIEVVREDVPEDTRVDAAVLHLARAIPTVEPRTRRSSGDTRAPGTFVLLMGFGSNESSGRSGFGRKRKALVPANGWGCDESRARWSGCYPGHEMLIPGNQGRDTCDGDSGGAVFEPHAGSWRLVAIVSRPWAVSRHRCGEGGIYARVDRLADWLQAQLKDMTQEEQSSP